MYDDKYQDITGQMTTISRELFERAMNPDMSIQEAVAYLRQNAQIRTLGSVLVKYAGLHNEEAVREKLTRGLMENHPETAPDTISRRVRDWMKTASRTVNKETAVELAYVLELDVKKADEFIAALTDEGFHWRDPMDLAYIFGLSSGMTYLQARELAEQMDATVKGNLPKSSLDKKAAKKKNQQIDESTMTQVVRHEAERLSTAAELLEFAAQSAPRLGSMHQTAYHMFIRMMDILGDPGELEGREELEEEGKMAVREILKVYMHREQVPQETKSGRELSAVERAIIKNWPTEKELSQMRSRAVEVSRKVLMLLFLATDGEPIRQDAADDVYDDDLWFDEEDEEDDDARFRSAFVRMETMLTDCGMRGIDLRVPFDWMILHCLCGADSLEIDGQVERFLETMFGLDGDDA